MTFYVQQKICYGQIKTVMLNKYFAKKYNNYCKLYTNTLSRFAYM